MPVFEMNIRNHAAWNELDDFTRGYIEAAFFTASFEGHYAFDDIDLDTLEAIIADCKAFYAKHEATIDAGFIRGRNDVTAAWRGGTDYWYTRNGHGTGFWENGRWEGDQGDILDNACKRACGRDLYVGDDGRIYQCTA